MRPAPHLGVVEGRILSTEIQLVMALIFITNFASNILVWDIDLQWYWVTNEL